VNVFITILENNFSPKSHASSDQHIYLGFFLYYIYFFHTLYLFIGYKIIIPSYLFVTKTWTHLNN